MTATVTPTTRLTVVKHLASGKTPDVVATITRLPRADIVDIGAHHGYPDKDKLGWAVDILEKKVDEENTAAGVTEGTSVPAGATRLPGETPALPRTATAPATGTESILALVNGAKGHPSKRIQTAANKVLDDLAKLRTLLAEDDEKHAARRRAAAQKAAARAEVDRLKKALAEAQAKLRGDRPPTPKVSAQVDGPAAKDIRAWAAANGVECPVRGTVPGSVRELFEAAHEKDS